MERAMSTVSCAQQPCSAPADLCLWLPIWGRFISYLVFLFFYHLLLFQRTLHLMTCLKYDSSSFVIFFFTSSDFSGLICSGICLFIFLVIHGIHRTLLKHHISNESFFFPIRFLHYLTFTSVHSNWEYEGMHDLSLGLLMIFPNSSMTALLSFSLLLYSQLQSTFEWMTEPR